jgi:hypothetical protein
MTGFAATDGSRYVLPSPAGALRATSPNHDTPQELLRALLRIDTTPELSAAGLEAAVPDLEPAESLRLLAEMHQVDLIELHDRPYRVGDQKVEVALPRLLRQLSAGGKGLLADNQGFLVSSSGFSDDHSIRLAAVASELASLDHRWQPDLRPGHLTTPPSWWTSSPDGGTWLGFVFLTIGHNPFVLIVQDEARLSTPAFVWLVWALSHRYDHPSLERQR